jgi:tetratricopeptide (TPR) repeat protein
MLHSDVESPESLAQSLKVQANELYAQRRYSDAISLYSQAVGLVPASPTYYSNRSAAYLMTQDYAACLKDCQAALERDEKMGKVWSRGLKCFLALWETQKAEDWIARGLEALKDDAHHATLLKEVIYFDFLVYWLANRFKNLTTIDIGTG